MGGWRRAAGCDSNQCPEVMFVKASGCEAGTCPEVYVTNVEVQFRDSQDPDTVVKIRPESWTVFVEAVKNGEFDIR